MRLILITSVYFDFEFLLILCKISWMMGNLARATWRYADPEPIMSDTAVYYLAVAL